MKSEYIEGLCAGECLLKVDELESIEDVALRLGLAVSQ